MFRILIATDNHLVGGVPLYVAPSTTGSLKACDGRFISDAVPCSRCVMMHAGCVGEG